MKFHWNTSCTCVTVRSSARALVSSDQLLELAKSVGITPAKENGASVFSGAAFLLAALNVFVEGRPLLEDWP